MQHFKRMLSESNAALPPADAQKCDSLDDGQVLNDKDAQKFFARDQEFREKELWHVQNTVDIFNLEDTSLKVN